MKTSEYQNFSNSFDIKKKTAIPGRVASTPHYHNAYELQYFLEGEADFFIRNQIYKARRGDLLFINTFEIHNATYNTDLYERIVVMYKPSLIQSLPSFQPPDVFEILDEKFNGTRLVSLPEEMQNKVGPLFETMLEKFSKNSRYTLIYLHSLLSLFLTYTGEHLDSVESVNSHPLAPNRKIQDIITYLDSNLTQNLSLDIISDHFNIDKYHLCRFFKKHTGLTIIEYINRMRVIQSEKLLMQNKHSITEICFMAGFNNLTHFERTFKKITGKSPRDYRKELVSRQIQEA